MNIGMNSLWPSFSFVRVSISSISSLVSISDTASQSSQPFSIMPAWIHIHSTSPNQSMKWCSSTKSLSTFVTLPLLHQTCFSTDFWRSKRRIIKEFFSFICYFSDNFFQHWLSWMMQGTKRRKEKKILFLQMSGLLQCSSFSLTPWFNSFLFIRCENIDLYRYSSVFKKKDWDISARAFFWNLHVDIYYCIICPAVVLYGAPTIRRQWKKWKIFKLICKMKEDWKELWYCQARVQVIYMWALKVSISRYQTIPNHTRPYQTIPNCTKPYQISSLYVQLSTIAI